MWGDGCGGPPPASADAGRKESAMFDRSRKSLGVALIVSAALVAATTPSFAHNAAYCDRYARHEANAGTENAMMWILPLAALGAGAGAVVGVAAVGAGIAVGTGAAVC